MDVAFLRWLDRIRERAGVPMVITDDARPPGVMPEGASKTSLHFRGRAVDLRSRDWTAPQKWQIAAAIVFLAADAPGKVEFEQVYSSTDRHWHLGVDERGVNHHLIESDE
jgi:hypothetical protein